jgi:uncharacterized membrane protein
MELTESDYLNMGISILGDRKKIMSLFEKQKQIITSLENNTDIETSGKKKATIASWVTLGILGFIIIIIGIWLPDRGDYSMNYADLTPYKYTVIVVGALLLVLGIVLGVVYYVKKNK